MSGHSKWSQIKRKKEAKDKVRGNIFSKLSRAITLAVLEGGGVTDPSNNVKLRLAIDKAKDLNMPKDNIDRAVAKGTGPNKDIIQEHVFEAFAPSQVAMIILTATDSVNRTLSEIKHVLGLHHGKLGAPGSVGYLFKKCGLMTIAKSSIKEEEVFRKGEQFGAFDIDSDHDFFYVYIPYDQIGRIKDQRVEIDFKPQSTVPIGSREEAQRVLGLVEALEEIEDVQKVFANFDIPEELMQRTI